MAVANYFTISNSNGSLIKRFLVMHSGYRATSVKSESVQHTLDGYLDASRGRVWEIHEYLVRVPFEVTNPDYGTLEDLRTFYSYANPGATPSDILTITDHYGTVRTGLFTKEFTPEPVGIMVDGADASFLVKCTFEFQDVVAAS